jgi:RNA polymerase primary sigma factor
MPSKVKVAAKVAGKVAGKAGTKPAVKVAPKVAPKMAPKGPVKKSEGKPAAEAARAASGVKAPIKDKKEEAATDKEAPDTPDAPLPLLDLSDAAVRKMIKAAKKRGYVTHDQVNAVLPSEEVTSDQIEDVFAMLSEMGINVVETEEAEADDPKTREEDEEEEESESGELVEVTPKALAKSEAKLPAERTDDPVRMYLREMGTVELLSREGEVAIAKRIEAGREAMIAGLCETR